MRDGHCFLLIFEIIRESLGNTKLLVIDTKNDERRDGSVNRFVVNRYLEF